MKRRPLAVALCLAFASPCACDAVMLNPDGLGQALVFPYYTVQSNGGDTYNTYISIVNTTADPKALRVRFREGRGSREAASFNLYLGGGDSWTGAIVPGASASDPPRLVTTDVSCTVPAFSGTPAALAFTNSLYSGTNDDGNGTGVDRAREGFVEAIEMATLTGAVAAALSHPTSTPPNCGSVPVDATFGVTAPTGGLMGTETLINVANGLDFDLNAVALADLSKHSFYRPAADPYPDFNAAEIDPVSVVVANDAAYRATWGRPVDAVSAVFMSTAFVGEYVLDDETSSNTDFVVTFPTRQFYATATNPRPPFTWLVTGVPPWTPHCAGGSNEATSTFAFNRDERTYFAGPCGDSECPPGLPQAVLCAATVVIDVSNGSPHTAITPQTRVLGSLVHGYGLSGIVFPGSFTHGWLRNRFVSTNAVDVGLTSLPDSTRMDLATGAITTGPQTYYGLPMIGFTARTFVNGTLTCSAGACQGNYGGAFPFQYTRRISP